MSNRSASGASGRKRVSRAAASAARSIALQWSTKRAVVETMERRVLLSAGAVDTSFGSGGTATLAATGVPTPPLGVATQSNGDVIVARLTSATSGNYQVTVTRLLPTGPVDTSFGTKGTTTLADGNLQGTLQDPTINVVVQPSTGDILIGHGVLARLTPTGKLDTTFAQAGELQGSYLIAGVAIQSDGRLLVASGDAVSRYSSTGVPDPTYGSNGTYAFVPMQNKEGDTLEPDVAGLSITAGGRAIVAVDYNTSGNTNFGVARLTTSGQLDTTFGDYSPTYDNNGLSATAGYAFTQTREDDPTGPEQVAVSSTGVIYLAGTTDLGSGEEGMGQLYAISSGGTAVLEAQVDNGGGVLDGILSLVVQPNGDPVIAGFDYGNDVSVPSDDYANVVQALQPADPGTDTSFTIVYNTELDTAEDDGQDGTPIALALEGDEKLLVARTQFNADGTVGVGLVTRLQGDATSFGTVSGTVFNDANSDGKQDDGETGVASEVVYVDLNNNTLFDAGEPYAVTAANGSYTIANVPAGAQIVRQSLPAGATETYPTNQGGQHVTIGSTPDTGVNFGAKLAATVSGAVLTSSGAGVSGVTVYLDANNNSKLDTGELSTTTGSSGAYTFANVPAGTYIVRQVLPTGDKQTSPTNNTGDHITVTSGQAVTGQNFTDTVPAPVTGATISGTATAGGKGVSGEVVYLDANNNSKLDTGELSTTTNSTGAYSFTNVPAGAYIIRQVLPTGYTQTSPSGGLGIHITASNGANLTNENFTDTAPTTGGGSVTQTNGVLTINGTAGSDTITVENDSTQNQPAIDVEVNGITSIFPIEAIESIVVNASAGNDDIDFDLNGSDISVPITLVGGNGNDTVNLEEDGGETASISVGGGNDSVTVSDVSNGLENLTIAAGNGNDSINVYDAQNIGFETVMAGNGNDTVSVGAIEDLNVSLGNGSDSLSAESTAATLNIGSGTDSVSLEQDDGPGQFNLKVAAGSAGDSITAGQFSGVVDLTATSGNDVVDLMDCAGVTVLGGSGNEKITVENAASNVSVIGGAGNDTISVDDGQPSDQVVVDGGGGINSITAPSYATLRNDVIGTVFADTNSNGKQDSSEASVSGVTVYDDVSNAGHYISGDPSTTTSATGQYTLDLPAGAAIIRVILPPGYTQTSPSGGLGQHVTIGDNTVTGANFGVKPPTQAAAAKLTGTVIGTGGSFEGDGNTGAKAFDGSLTTYYDAQNPTGDWTGLDLGTGHVITSISYAPRPGEASRMVGGMFQGSDSADFSGPVTTLYTITTAPTAGTLTTVSISSPVAFRYVRYIGPTNGYSNIAEAQFTGYAPVESATLTNGVLVVDGTNNADTINVSSVVGTYDTGYLDQVTVTVNGEQQSFNSPTPISIVINALGGDDSVTVESEMDYNVVAPLITIAGGDGNDGIRFEPSTVPGGQGYQATAFIDGGSGNDQIFVEGDGRSTLHGGDGNDTLGVAGDEVTYAQMYGEEGNDLLSTFEDSAASMYGGAGNDTLTSGAGDNDVISGGDGIDTYEPNEEVSNAVFSLDGKADSSDGATLTLDTDVENITIETDIYGPLVINGDSAANVITVPQLDGAVSINSGDGNDTISVAGPATVTAGNGNDVITLGNGGESSGDGSSLVTGNGNDTIYANNGENDTIQGGTGTDTAYIDVPSASVSDKVMNVKNVYEVPVYETYLTGTYIGTAGSYDNDGNTGNKAFDGILTNYFDGPDASGDWVGLDLGSPQMITGIGFAPRVGFAGGMVGGMFQASNTANFSSGVVTLYTVTSTPNQGVLNVVDVDPTGTYQYVRYIGPSGSHSDVAEVEFFGQA